MAHIGTQFNKEPTSTDMQVHMVITENQALIFILQQV